MILFFPLETFENQPPPPPVCIYEIVETRCPFQKAMIEDVEKFMRCASGGQLSPLGKVILSLSFFVFLLIDKKGISKIMKNENEKEKKALSYPIFYLVFFFFNVRNG